MHMQLSVSTLLCSLLFVGAISTNVQGQLARYDFQDVVSASQVAGNFHLSDLSISSGTIAFQNGNDDGGTKIGFASAWNQGAFDANGKYLSFSCWPATGYTLSLTDLQFRFGRTTTGPTAVTIQWSNDGFASFSTTILNNAAVSSTNTAALDAFSITQSLPTSTQDTIQFRIWGHNASGTGNLRFNNFRLFGQLQAPSPVIQLQPDTLRNFAAFVGAGPSASQSTQVSGSALASAGQLSMNAAGTDFELSTDNQSFSSQLQLAHPQGNMAATTVYVRLKSGLAAGTYNGQSIGLSGGGAPARSLVVSGRIAQAAAGLLRVLADSVVFGNLSAGQKDSSSFWVYNDGVDSLRASTRTFAVFGHRSFYTADSILRIPPGDSLRLWVYFEPVHNLTNKSVLYLDARTGSGPIAIPLKGSCTYSNAYYNATQGLSGQALLVALHNISGSPYQNLGYSGTNNARLRMFGIIDNWKVNGREPAHGAAYKNECVYTGRTISYELAAFNTGTLNNAPYQMNTEHTWPQSMGAGTDPMQSDLHHLFITDGPTNSARGNKPLGAVSSPTLTYTGGSQANTTTFEPRDAHKGMAARALLYFAMRYGDRGTTDFSWFSPTQADILAWHFLYPPDAVERRRNDDVQTYQLNRNPFIDHPDFLRRMGPLAATVSLPDPHALFHPDSILPGTVTQREARSYHFPIINSGNDTLQITNIQVSGSGLSYGGASSLQILPGERHVLAVEMQFGAQGGSSGTLQFNTNVPGKASVSVPVLAEVRANRWNGTGSWTQAARWSGGFVPDAQSEPLLESGQVTLGDTLSLRGLQVAVGATLRIAGGGGMRTLGRLENNGTIELADGASLLPADTNSLRGTGTYVVSRKGQQGNLKVNFWSAPVAQQQLATVFSGVTPSDIRLFNHGGSSGSDWMPVAGQMTAARGYSVVGGDSAVFSGTIHHGDYTAATNTGSGYYLIGNPYPAPLDAAAFLAENGPNGNQRISGALYFWAQQSNATGSNFAAGDYATWAGGTGVAGSGSNQGSANPNGQIGLAQGFFVQAGPAAGPIRIKPNMRSTLLNTQFFRSSGQIGRLWLKAVASDGAFSQTALVFRHDATAGIDPAYDAPRFTGAAPLLLSSQLQQATYAIQALPWPSSADSISLSLQLQGSKEVQLSIDSLAGIDSSFYLYLEDLYSGQVYDLRRQSPQFQLSAGQFNDRFVLHFGENLPTHIRTTSATTADFRSWVQDDKLWVDRLPAGALVRILNSNGQCMHEARFTGQPLWWDLPTGGPQLWILQVQSPRGVQVRKVIG